MGESGTTLKLILLLVICGYCQTVNGQITTTSGPESTDSTTAPTVETTAPPTETSGPPEFTTSFTNAATSEGTDPGTPGTTVSPGPEDTTTSEEPETTLSPTTEPPAAAPIEEQACVAEDFPGLEVPIQPDAEITCSPSTFYVKPSSSLVLSFNDSGHMNETCLIYQCPSGSLFDGTCCFNQDWIIGFAAGGAGLVILILVIVIIVLAATGSSTAAASKPPEEFGDDVTAGYPLESQFSELGNGPPVAGVAGTALIADAERGLRDSNQPNGYIDDRYSRDPTAGRDDYEEPHLDDRSPKRPPPRAPSQDFEELRKETGYDDRRREYPDDRGDRYDDRDSQYDDRRVSKYPPPPPRNDRYDDRGDRDRYDDRRDDRPERYADEPPKKRNSYREDRRDDYRAKPEDDRRREDDRGRGYDNKAFDDNYKRKDVDVIRRELEEKSMDEIKRSSAYRNFEPQLENVDTRPMEFKRPVVGKQGAGSRNSYGGGIYDDVYPTADRR